MGIFSWSFWLSPSRLKESKSLSVKIELLYTSNGILRGLSLRDVMLSRSLSQSCTTDVSMI